MKRIPITLLCAALLTVSAAYAEPQITVLPTLAPDVTITLQADEYVDDLTGYYSNNTYVTPDGESQYPSLTDAEKARVPDLLARYAGGERPKEDVVNKAADVVVGVYPLDPAEYQGEPVFVLLPFHALSDEELLEVIDGYAQLGLTFDAEGLSWRNCMRGGGIECNRSYAGDERERVETLRDLYKRQGLRPETAFTAIPGDDCVGEIALNADEYSGLEGFRFHPCRRMTDEELLRIIQNSIGEDIPDTSAYGQYEGQAREQLRSLLGMPLSAKRGEESIIAANHLDVFNDDREVYSLPLTTTDENGLAMDYYALLDIKDGTLYTGSVLYPTQQLHFSDLHCDPFDEKWVTLAERFVAQLRSDGMAVASVASRGEITMNDIGYGVKLEVLMADGSSYEVIIIFQNEALYSVNYRAQATTPDQVYAEYRDFMNH